VITLVLGAALAVVPGGAARLLGVDGHANGMRVIGLADLAVVPGLLRGRPRWPWVVARASLNLPMAAYARWLGGREGSAAARVAGVTLLGLTAADATLAWRLHTAERGHKTI